MYCSRCGTQNPDAAAFCGQCGASVPGGQPAPVQATGKMAPTGSGEPGFPPNGAWELVTSSYSTVWGNFWGFFRLAFLLFLLSIALSLIPSVGGLAAPSISTVLGLTSFVGGLLASAIATAAVVFAAILAEGSKELSAMRSIRAAFNRVLPVLGVILLSLLAIVALAITIIGIPFAIYFGVRWIFLIQVVMLERTAVLPAFSRSSDLVRGQWWRVFGSLLLMGLFSMLLVIVVLIFFGVLSAILAALSIVLDVVVFLLFLLLMIAAFVIFIPFTNVWGVFTTSLT